MIKIGVRIIKIDDRWYGVEVYDNQGECIDELLNNNFVNTEEAEEYITELACKFEVHRMDDDLDD